jgi:uncharacterized membrane-anchored protein
VTPRRRNALVAVVAAQVAIVLAMAGIAAADLAFGQEIRLRAQPVDPLDVFRGNYVVLRYDISTVTAPGALRAGDRVCAHVTERDGAWELLYASTGVEGSGTALCGRARNDAEAGSPVGVEYGLETYYASAERAKEIERALGSGSVYAVVDADDDGSVRLERLDVED